MSDAATGSEGVKRCDYCGRNSPNAPEQCRECGTPFLLPATAEPTSIAALSATLSSFFSASGTRIRRVTAAIIGAQAFYALGAGSGDVTYRSHFLLLAITYIPVAFVWCNVRPHLINRVLEGIGWALLLVFFVIGVGSM